MHIQQNTMTVTRTEMENLIFKYEELFASMTMQNNQAQYGTYVFTDKHMLEIEKKLIGLKAELRMMEDDEAAKQERIDKMIDSVIKRHNVNW